MFSSNECPRGRRLLQSSLNLSCQLSQVDTWIVLISLKCNSEKINAKFFSSLLVLLKGTGYHMLRDFASCGGWLQYRHKVTLAAEGLLDALPCFAIVYDCVRM